LGSRRPRAFTCRACRATTGTLMGL
jgi:hypothetical protein